MRFKRPFTLSTRAVKDGKPIWHASWHDAEGRRQRCSTGEANKALAEVAAVKMTRSRTGEAPTVGEYAAGFFSWG